MTIRGGGRRLIAKTILNFHFDYLTPSLSSKVITLIRPVYGTLTIWYGMLELVVP